MWILTQLFQIFIVCAVAYVLWAIISAPFTWYAEWKYRRSWKNAAPVDYVALYEDYRRRYKAGLPVPTAAAERFALDPLE